MRDYSRALSRVFSRPLMMTESRAAEIAEALIQHINMATPIRAAGRRRRDVPVALFSSVRAALAARLDDDDDDVAVIDLPEDADEDDKVEVAEGARIAVVGINGTLVHRSATASPPSGFVAYRDVQLALHQAVNMRPDGILMDIDSLGGEAVSSADETAALIRQVRKEIPVWAVADEMAASAAYLLGSAATRLLLPERGFTGSIGVIAMHRDRSEMDRKEGLTFTTIKAGERKDDLSDRKPLNEEGLAFLREMVAKAYDGFVGQVVLNRPSLSDKAIRNTEAAIFEGEDAVRAGLADAVMPFEEAFQEFAEDLTRRRASARGGVFPGAAAAAPVTGNQGKETEVMPDAETGAVTPQATSGGETSNVVDLNAAREEGRSQAQEIFDLCQLAGRPDLAGGYMEQNLSAAQVRKALLSEQAADPQTAVSGINPSAGATGTAQSNGEMLVKVCEGLAANMGRK